MGFWFSFKKLLGVYLNPLTIPLELIFTGIALIIYASRKPKKDQSPRRARWRAFIGDCGVFLTIVGTLVLFAAGIGPVAGSLTLYLEQRYPPLTEKDGELVVPVDPEFVVVLGSGHRYVEGRPILSCLSRVAFARVAGGVDLWKHYPDSKLVFTGTPMETSTMRAVAVELGVPNDRILEETKSRDTSDHPRYLKAIVGEKNFLLVTSAVHMPRSVALFHKVGLNFVPAPVDFVVWPRPETEPSYDPGRFIPRVHNLTLTAAALHEYGGLLWSRWNDEIE